MINIFKNKLRFKKKQVHINENVLKKYPNLYKAIYKRSKYKHIITSIILLIALVILLSYNKTYKGYLSDTTSVYFIETGGKFTVNVKENGKLQKIELYDFFKNYGDSFMFYSEIKDSVINLETEWSYRISFLLGKNYRQNDIRGDIVVINFDYDSLDIEKLKRNNENKIILLNKKYSWKDKSNYIIYKNDFDQDLPIFEYGKLFVMIKHFPFGLKIVSFEKER